MLVFHVTINYPDKSIEKEYTFPDLAELGDFLETQFPDATSFIVAWAF